MGKTTSLLIHEKGLRHDMGLEGRRKVEKLFDVVVIAQQIESIISKDMLRRPGT